MTKGTGVEFFTYGDGLEMSLRQQSLMQRIPTKIQNGGQLDAGLRT